LTFDDGTLEGSEKINDVIKQDKIKIDVFVVGSNIKSSKRLTGHLQFYDTNPWIKRSG